MTGKKLGYDVCMFRVYRAEKNAYSRMAPGVSLSLDSSIVKRKASVESCGKLQRLGKREEFLHRIFDSLTLFNIFFHCFANF